MSTEPRKRRYPDHPTATPREPTMASSIEWVERSIAELEELHLDSGVLAHYRNALAAMRAVEAMEREAERRQMGIQCDHLNERSLAFEQEGPRRWYVWGQGMPNNTKGRTMLEAIAAALSQPATPTRETEEAREREFVEAVRVETDETRRVMQKLLSRYPDLAQEGMMVEFVVQETLRLAATPPAPDGGRETDGPTPPVEAFNRCINEMVAASKSMMPYLPMGDALRKYTAALAAFPDAEREHPYLEHGCLTGDCPHGTQAECDKCLADEYRRIAVSIFPPLVSSPEPDAEREPCILVAQLGELIAAMKLSTEGGRGSAAGRLGGKTHDAFLDGKLAALATIELSFPLLIGYARSRRTASPAPSSGGGAS